MDIDTKRPWGTVFVSLVFLVFVSALIYAFWPNEDRIVRSRLSDVASILSVPAGEGDLPRIERIAHLRDYLAPDVRVRYGGQEATSRDMVLGALAQWGHAADGIKVAFVDVQVTFDAARPDAATAYLSATIRGRDTVDAREADVSLAKVAGKWVVTAAETKETLTR
jgi:hypothetical protein